jgi:hypothetical protein
MKVIITDRCDRCKREAPHEIEHTDVEPLQMAEQLRQANFEALRQVAETHVHALPDLIVIFKGTIRSTNHVCDANCKTTIEHSLEAVFRDIDPSQRAPRKTRTSSEVPVEGLSSSESSAASMTSTPASGGGSRHAGKPKK